MRDTTLDYGQVAEVNELNAAAQICRHLDVPLAVSRCVGLGHFDAGLVKGRNAFLLFAGLMAFQRPSGILVLGIHAGTNYYDCSDEFIAKMQDLFDAYTDGQVRISVPFLKWNKREIWEYCKMRQLPIELTYSCEAGSLPPCGRCLSCRDLEELRVR